MRYRTLVNMNVRIRRLINLFVLRVQTLGGTTESTDKIMYNQLVNIPHSALDKTSIILTPNGVSSGLLYSVKGDDSNKVVNGDFENGSDNWIKTNISLAEDISQFTNTANNGQIRQVITTVVGRKYKIIISNITGNWVIHASINTSTSGTLGSAGGGSLTFIATTTTTYILAYLIGSIGTIGAIGNLAMYDISKDMQWMRNSSATRVNKNGIIENTPVNVPRINYTNNTPAILYEPQSTNALTYSNDFSSYAQTRVNVTQNQTTSPSGQGGGNRFTPTNVTGTHFIQLISTQFTNDKTLSIFVKLDSLNMDKVTIYPGGSFTFANFNLTNLTMANEANVVSSKIEPFGNGWYRLSATYNSTIVANRIRIYASSGTIGASLTTENGTDGIFIYGAGYEAQRYATSYVETVGTASTRLQDLAVNSGQTIDFNSEEGVLYAYLRAFSESRSTVGYISISDGTTNNLISIGFDITANNFKVKSVVNGISQIDTTVSVADITAFNKIAFGFSLNDFNVWVNGQELFTSNLGIVPAANTLNTLSMSEYGTSIGKIDCELRDLRVYKEKLTSVQLQNLTT